MSNKIIYKDDAISVIRILADKMVNENAEVIGEQFIAAIEDLRWADDYDWVDKLHKECRKKKKWKNKYLKTVAEYNRLQILYSDICNQLQNERLQNQPNEIVITC